MLTCTFNMSVILAQGWYELALIQQLSLKAQVHTSGSLRMKAIQANLTEIRSD